MPQKVYRLSNPRSCDPEFRICFLKHMFWAWVSTGWFLMDWFSWDWFSGNWFSESWFSTDWFIANLFSAKWFSADWFSVYANFQYMYWFSVYANFQYYVCICTDFQQTDFQWTDSQRSDSQGTDSKGINSHWTELNNKSAINWFFVEKQGYILLHPDIHLVLECLHISKYVYIQNKV